MPDTCMSRDIYSNANRYFMCIKYVNAKFIVLLHLKI